MAFEGAQAFPALEVQIRSVLSHDAETARRSSEVTATAVTLGMAFEGAQAFPALEVPDPQRFVHRRRRCAALVGGHSHGR